MVVVLINLLVDGPYLWRLQPRLHEGKKNIGRGSYFGLAIIIVFSIFAVFAPIIAPHDPNTYFLKMH